MKNFIAGLMVVCASTAPGFAEGDAKAGKKVFKKCAACHTVKEGRSKSGPSLYKIIGAESATVDGYKYSDAMASADLVWDKDTLSAFLAKPKDLVPGTKMAFPGLKKQEQIDDLVAYLIAQGEK